MNKNRTIAYRKQLFAPETNTTVAADLEPVISIDHTNQLVAGIKSLLTVLGIFFFFFFSVGTTVNIYTTPQRKTADQGA